MKKLNLLLVLALVFISSFASEPDWLDIYIKYEGCAVTHNNQQLDQCLKDLASLDKPITSRCLDMEWGIIGDKYYKTRSQGYSRLIVEKIKNIRNPVLHRIELDRADVLFEAEYLYSSTEMAKRGVRITYLLRNGLWKINQFTIADSKDMLLRDIDREFSDVCREQLQEQLGSE